MPLSKFAIQPQPDDSTCGPTCLHAVYRHHGLDVSLEEVITSSQRLEHGGTVAVLLGQHALMRDFSARVYTWNLRVFDPTWFEEQKLELYQRLEAQSHSEKDDEVRRYSREYLHFLELGGEIQLTDLTTGLLRKYLRHGTPLITGLSATYLYRTAREFTDEAGRLHYDDVYGTPQGHFVVLVEYDPEERAVLVADPLQPNPVADSPCYWVPIDRLVNAILLGILTHDANLLVLQPPKAKKQKS